MCLAFFEQDEYRSMAMPIKIFEYLSYLIPIITTKGTAAGEFVEKNNIGWNISYDETEIKELLIELNDNFSIVIEKHKNAARIISENTWEMRALKVCKDLTNNF